MPLLPHALRRGSLALVAAACALVCLAPSSRADATGTAAVVSLRTTIAQSLQSDMSTTGPRTYADGAFSASDGPPCWYCYDSAAVGAAVLSQQVPADASLESVAVDTFDTAIADHQLADGAFTDDDGAPDGITTGFFTVDLGMAYLELRGSLSPADRTRWSNSIAAAARYLIASGNTNWYANGNIVLRQTEVLWLAYAATGDPSFLTAYDAEYDFALDPPQARWPGFGLQITRAPTTADDSDGAGYLAESGGGAPGFDPNYTQAQLDTACDLYVLTHDPRYLKLINLLYNQLTPLIDSGWVLNATGGTRESFLTPFFAPAPAILAASGERPDITGAMVQAQVSMIESQYLGADSFTNVNFYKGFEGYLAVPLLNLQWPDGMAPDTRVSSGATGTAAAPVAVAVTPNPVTSAGTGTSAVTVTVSGVSRGTSATVAVVDAPASSKASGTTLASAPATPVASRPTSSHGSRRHRVTETKGRLRVTLRVARRLLRAGATRRRLSVDVMLRSGHSVHRVGVELHVRRRAGVRPRTDRHRR